jgi:hypothetical protein
MRLTDTDREKLKRWPVNLLLNNKQEQYYFHHFIKEYDNSGRNLSFGAAILRPAQPISVGNSYALLPFFENQNEQLSIKHHYYSQNEETLLLFFDWHLSDIENFHHFFALCQKLNHRGLYAATVCHELYPNSGSSG